MCTIMPLNYWLMQFLLLECCEVRKNKMADTLGVERQTLRRAFRRAEQDNAKICSSVSEKMMLYLFDHREVLDRAFLEYGEQTVRVCPQAKMANGYNENQDDALPDEPAFPEVLSILEILKKTIESRKKKPYDNACYTDHYCQYYENCPLHQLVVLYAQYMIGRPAPGTNPKGGDAKAGEPID